MTRTTLSLWTLFALSALTAPALAQQVHRVDVLGTGGAFTNIQPAIDAAIDGDLVLVADGTYGGFTIDAKGVQVFADSGALPLIKGPMIVRNLAAGQLVALHGLTHEIYVPAFQFPSPAPVGPILDIANCSGVVHVQDCDLTSTDTFQNSPAGLRATNVAELVVERTVINSLDGSTLGDIKNLYALELVDSNAYLYSCELTGTRGVWYDPEGEGPFPGELTGSPAIEVRGGNTLLVDCDVTGGAGSTGAADTASVVLGFFCYPTGAGAPAIRVLDGSSTPVVSSLGTTFTPGAMGDLGSFNILMQQFSCVGGLAGTMDVDVQAGSIDSIALSPRGYRGTPVTRPGELKSMTFTGEPFDLIWILYSLDPGMNLYSPTLSSVVVRTMDQFLFFMGKLNASGMRTKTLTLNPIGIDYLPLYEQAFFFNATDGLTSSNPRVAALVGLSVP